MSTAQVFPDARSIARRFVPLHRWLIRLTQIAIFLFAGVSAFLLRFDFAIPGAFRHYLLSALIIWVIVKVIVFHLSALDRGWWRYTSVSDLVRLIAGNIAGSIAASVAIMLLAAPGFPRSIYVLDFLLCLCMTAGIRLCVRVNFEISRSHSFVPRKRTLIFGAGEAGVSLLREIGRNSTLAYQVLGFIDDDATKTGRRIHQATVLGVGADLSSIVKAHNIEMILIAIPSATGLEMTRILNRCSSAGVAYKTVPGLAEVIESSGLATQIRDVAVEDLLGRAPIRLDDRRIRGALEGKVVLVTVRQAPSDPSSAARLRASPRPGSLDSKSPSPPCLRSIAKCARPSLRFPSTPKSAASRTALASTRSCVSTGHRSSIMRPPTSTSP